VFEFLGLSIAQFVRTKCVRSKVFVSCWFCSLRKPLRQCSSGPVRGIPMGDHSFATYVCLFTYIHLAPPEWEAPCGDL
jgi:hypothetical protein